LSVRLAENHSPRLLVPSSVLNSADGILYFTGSLVGFAFGLQLGITGYLTGGFLNATLDFGGSALNTILIHYRSFLKLTASQQVEIRA
jgi:hypothetical protein